MKTISIIFFLLLLTTTSQAKIYKWTDADGNTHYSSEKPEDKNTQEVKVNTRQPKVTQKTTKSDKNQPSTNTTKEKTYMEKHYEKKEKAKKLAKENKKHCLDAKATINKFQRQVRMSRVDKKTGETIFLDDSKRAEYIKTATKRVKKYCR